jgi:hypothetical protein
MKESVVSQYIRRESQILLQRINDVYLATILNLLKA